MLEGEKKKEISKRTQDQGSSLRYSSKEKEKPIPIEKKKPKQKHHTMQVIIATVKEPPISSSFAVKKKRKITPCSLFIFNQPVPIYFC